MAENETGSTVPVAVDKIKTLRASWTCNTSNNELNSALEEAFKASHETSKNRFLEQFLLNAVKAEKEADEFVVDSFIGVLSKVPGLLQVYEARSESLLDESFEKFIMKCIDFACNYKRYKNFNFSVPSGVQVNFGANSFFKQKEV